MIDNGASKKTLLLLFAAIVGLLAVYYAILLSPQRNDDLPSIRSGVLDLSGDKVWPASGLVKLDGPWPFYWKQLLVPDQKTPPQPTGMMPVPGHWSGSLNGVRLDNRGYGTYRLTLKLPPNRMYAIRVMNIQMSSVLYVNGERVGASGAPGTDRTRYTPQNRPYNAYFTAPDGIAELLLQTANFDFVQGGIPYSLTLGTVEAINGIDKASVSFNIVVEMSAILLGLYHIGEYMTRREEKGFLYFGLSCLCAGVGYAAIGDKLFMQLFGGLPFELAYKIQHLAVFGTILLLAMFVKQVTPEQIPAWLPRTTLRVFGGFELAIAVLPLRIYSYLTFIFSTLEIAVYGVIIFFLSTAYLRRQYGQLTRSTLFILIAAFCCLTVTVLDGSFHLIGLLPNSYLSFVTGMLFAVFVSALLAWRFAAAYRTVERLSVQLVEADRLKDEFIANTSHEFQTPLNGIINISQSLLEEAAGAVNDKQKESLDIVVAAAKRLSMLVHDILDLERIKRGELLLQQSKVDLKVTVDVVLELFPYLTSDNVRLVLAIPDRLPLVEADEHRLRQVVYNLVGNAVKFTEFGQVTVTAVQVGEYVELAVEDTGIGIPEHRRAAVFEPFEQGGEDIGRQYGGTGLGLSVSSKLMRLMNGQLRIDWSEVGVGSRFVCRLPVAEGTAQTAAKLPIQAAVPASAQSAAAIEQDGAFTLLAVDDEPANLQVLLHLFGGRGYKLLTATNGDEALRRLQTTPGIDLVLLDVMMPKLSGFEVCRIIRRRYALFELPVVLLTVRGGADDIAQGFEAGANDYLVKPFDASEVRARVQTLLLLKKSVNDALGAEMAFLQSQIKPHFLFNALNAILSFCNSDSARAAQLIAHLSDYLRHSFDIPGTATFVSLENELQLVQAYVEIEKARFEERLTLVTDIDSGALKARLLPLTIQPLVENAIRHGIMKREEGGVVRLSVRIIEEGLLVQVSDNGVGLAESRIAALLGGGGSDESRERGVGLPNIHRRLSKVYGAGLTIDSREGEGTTVAFVVRNPESLAESRTSGGNDDAKSRDH